MILLRNVSLGIDFKGAERFKIVKKYLGLKHRH